MSLDVASGVARGASAFVQNFFQGKQQKHQMDLQKNLPLIEILQQRISDPNTNYYERAKIIDQLPGLLGIKNMERPLSHMLGYDKLNEQDFQTESKQNTQVDSAKGYTEQTSNPIAGQENVQGPDIEHAEMPLYGTTGENVTKKYGEMTPNDIHQKLQLDLEKARDEGDLKKAERLAKINFNLQEQSYKANGYKVVQEGEVNGEYVQVLMNNSGDQKINKMPKGFKPLKLSIAETNAKKYGGKMGQLVTMHGLIDDYEGSSDHGNVSDAEYKAAKEGLADFELNGVFKKETIKALRGKLSGEGPAITPQQNITNTRIEAKEIATMRAAANRAKRETTRAGLEAGKTADAAHKHVINTIDPLKAQIKARLLELDEDPEKPSGTALEDPVLKGLQDRLRTETDRYNDLKGTADTAASSYTSLQDSQKEAEEILAEYTGSTNAAGGKKSSYTPKQKAMIERVRKDSGEAAANLTDDQIAEQILASPYKTKFK